MKIGAEDRDDTASMRRRWGLPLGVAAGVAAVCVGAVAVFGGSGGAAPSGADRALGGSAKAAAPPRPSASRSPVSKSPEKAFAVTGATTTRIGAGSTGRILSSCLGADASRYHSVIALRAPVAAPDTDGVVVAADPAGQYVQCGTKGDTGSSQDHPPTFINNRMWGTGRTISYFDASMVRIAEGRYLLLGAGHFTSAVAKVTISYGDQPKEYPAVMSDGAFAYAAAITPDTPPNRRYPGPTPWVHAYNASGKEIYNQSKDPKFTADK